MLLCLVLFPALSQDLTKKITLNATAVPLSEVLVRITESTGIRFSYNPREIKSDRQVTVLADNRVVSEVLDEILLHNGIGFSIVEGHLVLKPRAREDGNVHPKGQSNKTSHVTVSGFLKDKATGEALIGANVYLKGGSAGAMTNGYGFYSLTLPEGAHSIVCSYVGYREEITDVVLRENTRLSMEMEAGSKEMGEVEIVAAEAEPGFRNSQMSEFRFSQKTLSELPGFGGNMDIIRALQAVPGIQNFGDGSALYYVRGGNSDQNLLLIDEVPVYNPSHLFGFFSAFAPDAVNSVQIYKGDFPARFGGRLSSVIDIKAKEGNLKHFGFSGNIGPYASSLSLEGPILKNKASFFISGRVSTLNWLNNLTTFNKSFDFRFFDVNAKLNWTMNETNRLFFTFYTGQDVFSRYFSAEVNSLGIDWNNVVATLRWNHLFSSRLFANTTLNYSRYNYALNLPQEQNGYWNSQISNLTLKSDLAWYANPQNTIRTGLEVTRHYSNPGNVTLEGSDGKSEIPDVARYHSMEYVLYASNEQRIGKRLSLRYGIRLPVWQDFGPTDVYFFDANHRVIDTIGYGNGVAYATYFSPEPRLNIQYRLGEKGALKASYTRMTQFLQMISNSVSPFTSLEVWAPCGPNIKPQVADQVALGYFREDIGSWFDISAEGYYKWFHDHLDYKDHANLLYNSLIEGELRFGKAWSYGVEVMARKSSGKLTGWLGYTWSRSMIETPGINNDAAYPASYDRPHNVSVNVSWDDRKRWKFSASWIYLTGGAITMPVGFYYVNGSSVPMFGDKNNDRLPDYHRLDLSASCRFNKPGNRFQHSLAVTLYNAYGRMNPFSVNFNKKPGSDGTFIVPADLNSASGLVPTTISVAGIIPSINYLFRF